MFHTFSTPNETPGSLAIAVRLRDDASSCSAVGRSGCRPAVGALLSLTLAPFIACGPAVADPAEVFAKTCAGCHAAGDLERNGVSDVDTIYALIYGGKNKMPGYGEQCTPKGQCTFGPRLADDDVRDLAQYVLDQSKAGWK